MEQLRRAKPHQTTTNAIHGSEQQLKDMTLGDLIGKRKRAHTNYTEDLTVGDVVRLKVLHSKNQNKQIRESAVNPIHIDDNTSTRHFHC
ncbi:hypothetical protein PRIPAC_97152 [Pristionchus pacificus]|uniref:Uncharacterized protein n=1 Tax=Pristionchus pacificus TaxID=54126 RepID=A0A2A6BCV6_PRIPA|nr:hypothetical protein PRIPAC_97152 [Pristionchus pacificus]|eukprot:PDM63715.1 hypothetical protein PRIPAC_49688 [Pristionchus pacificus]